MGYVRLCLGGCLFKMERGEVGCDREADGDIGLIVGRSCWEVGGERRPKVMVGRWI